MGLQLPAFFARSLARRLVLTMAGLTVAAMAMLYVTVYSVSSNAMTRTLAATVDTDLAGLADIYASNGQAELISRLGDREDMVSIEAKRAYYMLIDTNGTRLAGTITRWPTIDAGLSEQGYVRVNNGISVYARATRLSPDLNLLVARDHQLDSAFLRQLSGTFAAVAAAVLIAAMAVGHIASRRLLARIEHVTLALQRGDEAALDPDRPDTNHGDEITLLARTSADIIARANRLSEMHRHMSDQVAHEVRTPLMHLDNRLITALRGGLTDDDRAHQLDEARRDIRQIAALLNSLLDIAANEARRGDHAGLAKVDLSALGHEIADLYQASMEEAGLTLTASIAPGVTLQGEAMQLTRLLSNLLDNAIKYVPSGGAVTLTITAGPQIHVSDNGPGIGPELRAHLFERFRRGAVHSARGGHGLGLALARAICERHGLSIALLDNEPGACFTIGPEAEL